jgi:hypothetical protein
LNPGFKSFEIIPHLGKRLTWVKGSTPTPAGPISAEFNTGTGLSRFTIPTSTYAKQICIPLGGSTAKAVYVNKKWYGKPQVHKGSQFAIQGDYFCLTNVKAGNYECKVIYSKTTKPQP